MGCDIHCYIEYRKKGETGNWNGFGGRINPGRYYAMFSILAKVRSDDDSPKLFSPKGMPEDCGFEVNDDYSDYISDDGRECHVSKHKAAEWVAKGWSKYRNEHWVTNPDWHSHSWLTPDEYERAIKAFYAAAEPHKYALDPEYLAILECLRSFEKSGHDSRLVFWFDN